jgi:hypothetical protein
MIRIESFPTQVWLSQKSAYSIKPCTGESLEKQPYLSLHCADAKTYISDFSDKEQLVFFVFGQEL